MPRFDHPAAADGKDAHRGPIVPALLVLVLVVSGCRMEPAPGGRGAGDVGDQREAVRAAVRALIAADNAGDLNAVLSAYGDDALLLPPGGAPIRGREALRRHYAKIFRATRLELEVDSRETRILGAGWALDRGVTFGRAVAREGGEVTPIRDRYVMLLRRDPEGTWRVVRLIWNAAPDGAPA